MGCVESCDATRSFPSSSQFSSFFYGGLIVPARMTFVSSTFCPRPAEASSAREPAARRKIESFERTSNDDASPCLARSVFDPGKLF